MRILIAFLVVGFLSFSYSAHADEFSLEEFEKLLAELDPKDEVWKSIPWHVDLLSAQAEAVKQKKPIFIWSMDGHPLGCT